MESFRGKAVLIVNVASKCGYTPQYEGLQKLYLAYKDKGLVILGVPANEFREQEPGTNAEIKQFCTAQYGVTFPMLSKMVVKGPESAVFYRWLIDNGPRHEDIEWNFAKFLIGKRGEIKARYLPKIKPDDEGLIDDIEKALGGN